MLYEMVRIQSDDADWVHIKVFDHGRCVIDKFVPALNASQFIKGRGLSWDERKVALDNFDGSPPKELVDEFEPVTA